MFEDSTGKIWMLSFNLKLCYFENGKFHPYPYNDLIEGINNRNIYSSFYVDTDGAVWLSFQQGPMIKIDQ